MMRSRHPFAALVLALLLVGMQYGSQLHALEHIEEALKNAPHQSFGLPEDELCALCALFAGGANALTAEIDPDPPAFVSEEHRGYAPSSAARIAPRFYDSRAPPAGL
jgi:hypothetical protein